MFDSSSNSSSRSFPLAFCGPLLVALIVARFIGSVILFTYDDAFITYRYARNLATGHGFIYHPGEWVLGATCPAFGVFAALLYKLGLNLPAIIILINIVCDAALLYFVGKALSARVSATVGVPLLSALAFALFFTLSPTMTRICVGGMEMNLFLLGSLTAIFLFHRGAKIPAVALAAACYFLRPEGALLVCLLCGLELIQTRRLAALRLPLVAACVLAPFLFLILHYYGHILPQSVMAKSQTAHPSVFTTAKALLIPEPVCLVFLPLALWGLVCFSREKGWREDGFLRTLGMWCALYLAAYLAARPKIWSWYVAPIQFVIIIFAAVGAAHLLALLPALKRGLERRASLPPGFALTTGAVAVAFWTLILMKQHPSGVTRSVYAPLQKWGQAVHKAKPTVVAADIGAIGYFSDAYIYDAAGLVWPPALKYKFQIDTIIKARHPDYLFLNAQQGTIEMMQKSHLNALYKPVQRFSPDNETELRQDPKLYPSDWKQDYILYKRRATKK